jgi:hypothetical protein
MVPDVSWFPAPEVPGELIEEPEVEPPIDLELVPPAPWVPLLEQPAIKAIVDNVRTTFLIIFGILVCLVARAQRPWTLRAANHHGVFYGLPEVPD